MVEYTEISEDAWNQIPEQRPQQPDVWEPLLADLSQGKIVSLPYSDPKDRRSKRLSNARRAWSWGFKTEARYTDSHLAVKRTDTAAPPPPPDAQPRRQRRRQESAEG